MPPMPEADTLTTRLLRRLCGGEKHVTDLALSMEHTHVVDSASGMALLYLSSWLGRVIRGRERDMGGWERGGRERERERERESV